MPMLPKHLYKGGKDTPSARVVEMPTKSPVEAAEDCVQGAPPIVVAPRLKGLGLRINGSILRRSQGLIVGLRAEENAAMKEETVG
ncbi:hypothetical protein NE237_016371 [Protea cynaroides]|uniref:Uncharacterized protein n=1 Tax=Protea cynaroides TaxID=273540 RepID=A0A9Q0GMY3_9MAGN|nr:hypothetical protein NE237_016371 [Protea cynaroides]